MLNVDQPKNSKHETHNSSRFEQEWAKQRTYLRWAESGTFYGFAYHGGAMLAAPMDEPPLWRHFGQMYFDQVLLLLYLRVTLFRFSTQLNNISSATMKCSDHARDNNREWLEHFQQLRRTFMHFTNLYQFPLISNQQQGIEMYSLAREVMDVDEFYREIKEEIHNANDYLTAQENHQLTDTTTKLTKVATIVLPIVLASSFLGMNMFSGEGCWSSIFMWALFTVIVAVGYLKLIPFVTGKKLSEVCSSPTWLASLENFVERQLSRLKNIFCGHTTKGTD